MGFLKKLFGGSNSSLGSDFYVFSVTCDRCGETIAGKVNLNNDLSQGEGGGYHVRKVLIGSGHCFQQIQVEFKFSSTKEVTGKHIEGGKFTE